MEFILTQIRDRKIYFRFNLNSLRTEEKDVSLDQVSVDDGQWHSVKVSFSCTFIRVVHDMTCCQRVLFIPRYQDLDRRHRFSWTMERDACLTKPSSLKAING